MYIYFHTCIYISDKCCRRSPSACETVYTKHVHMSFILNEQYALTNVALLLKLVDRASTQKNNPQTAPFVFSGKGLTNPISGPELCSKTTNCSRIPLIAKWYLGGPSTKSLMTRWSMDDVSLQSLMY